MKVLLLKDVYKLGRAGEVKKVAPGYGRNYLIPQGLATIATAGAVKQAERIKKAAEKERARLNLELEAVASQLEGLQIAFPVKAGETGKLYGSITPTMISEKIEAETGIQIDKRNVEGQPIKTLGVHEIPIRLTIDLIPEISVVAHREGEPVESVFEEEAPEVIEEEAVGTFTDLQAELEAEEAELVAEEQVPEEEGTEEGEAGDLEGDVEGAEAEEIA